MIVVDSSVWIDNLLSRDTEQVRRLAANENPDHVLVGDVILLEVLRGVRDEYHAIRIERDLRQYPIVRMLDDRLAVQAAANYRFLRTKGITIRKSADLIIATFCIERGHALLHTDRDFLPMAEHLGLRCL